MICCLASAACPLRDTAAPLAACGGREGIRAVYDAGIDLGHYGEVDQLAPAGAMAEFLPVRAIISSAMFINLLAAIFVIGFGAKHVKKIYNVQN